MTKFEDTTIGTTEEWCVLLESVTAEGALGFKKWLLQPRGMQQVQKVCDLLSATRAAQNTTETPKH